jgi:hypothetical protein
MNITNDILLKPSASNMANWRSKYPDAFSELKKILETPGKGAPKGYCLSKRPSKRYGFLYYVRYVKDGKEVRSKWNTHTNNLEEAQEFAVKNRDRLLAEYHEKRVSGKLCAILSQYYAAGSEYLVNDKNRGRSVGKKTRSVYFHFINKIFIPFLQGQGVRYFEEIDLPMVVKFQDFLLAKGNKPQTANKYIGCIQSAFDQLLRRGIVKENVFYKVRTLRTGKTEKIRGCHEIDEISGAFSTPWPDTLKYLLALVIYTTGMRNSEIERALVKDIIKIEGCWFFNVQKSKTQNGVRIVPLHDFVYQKISDYISETGKGAEDFIFSYHGMPNQSTLYKSSNLILGGKLGYDREYLEKHKITFYSGRHFWKTLMSAEGLGEDIEECFMGHKVSGDVAKRYNHKDKRGQKRIAEKAKEVFAILDKKVF